MTDQETIIYPYECNFTLADTAPASFEVEIVSSATTATTDIATPTNDNIPTLIDNGSLDLGNGSSLRGTTYVVRGDAGKTADAILERVSLNNSCR